MGYERPAIERRVELTSPVITIAAVSPGFGISPTWKRPSRRDETDGGPAPTR